MVSIGPRFDLKAVLDSNRETVGTVIGSELSDGTREPTSLLIALTPELREEIGDGDATLWLPFARVRSIRRDEVELGDAILDLLKDETSTFTVHRDPGLSSLPPE